ncbi:Pre-mRNA-splicing factor cwf19, partial [Massospora cicadina]
MFAEQDKGVVFMETVLNLTNCYHTVIECIPLPWGDAEDAPGYFKEGLLEADEEWSRHSKVDVFPTALLPSREAVASE